MSKPAKRPLMSLEGADESVANALAPYRKTAVVRAISLFGKLGDQPPLRMLCVAVLAAGAVGRRPALVRAAARMLVAHTVATSAKDIIKHRIDRTRPNDREDSAGHRITAGRSRAKKHTSFPSGHSAGVIAVARAYGREFPAQGQAAAMVAVAVSLAQVVRGSHYPSDVAAGLAIGTVGEAAADRLLGPLLAANGSGSPTRMGSRQRD